MSKSQVLFTRPEAARKGERTRLKLIESAFLCIARDGYYRTTFQTIADRAKVSQPLVVKAFRTRENIFPVVCGHLLELAIRQTEERLRQAPRKAVDKQIETYFDVSIEMLEAHSDLALFYMNLYYLSTYDESARKLYAHIRKNAVARLEAMLNSAKRSAKNAEIAEALHDYLTGFILNTIAASGKWDKARLNRGLRSGWLKGLGL